MDAAASRIRLVEQIVASHIWSGGTRAEALAHLAKIGQIELDAGVGVPPRLSVTR